MESNATAVPAGEGASLTSSSSEDAPNPLEGSRQAPAGASGFGSNGDRDVHTLEEHAAVSMAMLVRSKVDRWFSTDHTEGTRGPMVNSGTIATALDAEVARVRAEMPSGYSIEALLGARNSPPNHPCSAFILLAAGRAVGTVLVFLDSDAQDQLAHRARQLNVFPPRLGLISSNTAICFSCNTTLAEALAARQSTASAADPVFAAETLHALCSILHTLHDSGFAVGSLTPEHFVKPGPVPCANHWKLSCLHKILPQGCTVAQLDSDDVRVLAPEHAQAIRNGASLVIDAAADIFALGLMAYELVTGRSYWDGLTDAEVLSVLLGCTAMPPIPLANPRSQETSIPVPSHAQELLALIADLLKPLAPARPLAGDATATLQEMCMRMHPESDLGRIPRLPPRPPLPPTLQQPDRAGTQPLRISLALGKREVVLEGSSECVRARLLKRRRVFQLERGVPLEMVLLIVLADSAVVPVFPLRSTSHFLVECGASEGQVVELTRDEPLMNGRARLLSGDWDAGPMLETEPSGSFLLHIFAQVCLSELPQRL
jgi:hypothetical protein